MMNVTNQPYSTPIVNTAYQPSFSIKPAKPRKVDEASSITQPQSADSFEPKPHHHSAEAKPPSAAWQQKLPAILASVGATAVVALIVGMILNERGKNPKLPSTQNHLEPPSVPNVPNVPNVQTIFTDTILPETPLIRTSNSPEHYLELAEQGMKESIQVLENVFNEVVFGSKHPNKVGEYKQYKQDLSLWKQAEEQFRESFVDTYADHPEVKKMLEAQIQELKRRREEYYESDKERLIEKFYKPWSESVGYPENMDSDTPIRLTNKPVEVLVCSTISTFMEQKKFGNFSMYKNASLKQAVEMELKSLQKLAEETGSLHLHHSDPLSSIGPNNIVIKQSYSRTENSAELAKLVLSQGFAEDVNKLVENYEKELQQYLEQELAARLPVTEEAAKRNLRNYRIIQDMATQHPDYPTKPTFSKDIKDKINDTPFEQLKTFAMEENTLTPTRILLQRPLAMKWLPSFLGTKSFSGSMASTHDGSIALTYAENQPQRFKAVQFLEQRANTDVEYPSELYAVTEINTHTGEEETYQIRTGVYNAETQKYQFEIICPESGNSTAYHYDDSKPTFWSTVKKPVIAFRQFPAQTSIRISVQFNGQYEVVYPSTPASENNTLTWDAITTPTHLVTYQNRQYPYLFWDGLLNPSTRFEITEGYCVSSQETMSFLEQLCITQGLDAITTADFVTFWAPLLQQNPYNKVRLLSQAECNQVALLNIDTTVEHRTYRFYMVFEGVDQFIPLAPPTVLETGLLLLEDGTYPQPTVIDWGGFQQ
jgi:hypothetical protein